MRKRWKTFLGYLLDEIIARGLFDFEDFQKHQQECFLAAGRRMEWRAGMYYKPLTQRQILKRANGLMSLPDMQAGLRAYFGKVANFTPDDAANKLADLIREGKTEDVQFRALSAYLRLAFPQPTKQVNVKQQTLVARVSIGDEPPKMRTRQLEPPRRLTPAEQIIEGVVLDEEDDGDLVQSAGRSGQ